MSIGSHVDLFHTGNVRCKLIYNCMLQPRACYELENKWMS
jgi:hypothetical protein